VGAHKFNRTNIFTPRHTMVRFLSSLVLLLKASTMVHAGVGVIPPTCVNFTSPGESIATELCYSGGFIGPSICLVQLPNGTEVDYYCGDLNKLTYLFESESGTLESSIEWGFYNTTYPNEQEEVISETSVCNATFDGLSCDTCIFCDDGSVEADCTNLELGTKVECGEIFVNSADVPYPFFPFLVEKSMGSTCEVGPMANPDMSCPEAEFCQLTEGLCNNKMGFHTGMCATIPTVCTMIYRPVW